VQPSKVTIRLPSTAVIVVATLAAILAIVCVAHGISDADYFWHVTVGKLVADTRTVPSVDPFSFTWGGQPWTPHEWLGELFIYGLLRVFGQTGMVVAFGLVSACIVVVVGAMLIRRGVSLAALALPLVLIVLLVGPYATIRPQVLSWLLLATLLWMLALLRAEHAARAWLLVPFFVLWANVHGLYVIGLGVVATYALFTLIGRTPMRGAKAAMTLASVGALLASMATPAGPIGLLYPLRYVDAGDWGLANILEWQSPNFHQPAHLPFLLLMSAMMLVGLREVPGWMRALAIGSIAMGLLALRNIPLAAVLATPALAIGIQGFLKHGEHVVERVTEGRAVQRRMMEIAGASVIVIATSVMFAPLGIGAGAEAAVAKSFPVAAVNRLAQVQPTAHVLAEYGWGGYVIHELYARGGRVFVDGRNDMYSQQILDDYLHIRNADDGWQGLVDRYGVDAMLLPPGATITRGAATTAGWCESYRDEMSVLLLRGCGS
jgi:hypothetical protein